MVKKMDYDLCIPCNKFVYDTKRHYKSMIHHKFTLRPKTGSTHCILCDMICPNIISHMQTDEHLAALKKMKDESDAAIISKFKYKMGYQCRYYQANRAKMINFNLDQYQKKRTFIREKVKCQCGSLISRGNMPAHVNNSMKHRRLCPETDVAKPKKKILRLTCECGKQYIFNKSSALAHPQTLVHLRYLETGETWERCKDKKTYNDQYYAKNRLKILERIREKSQ